MPESVSEYPRPPALQACARRVRIGLGGRVVADSRSALRILETSHPPTIYIPSGNLDEACFVAAEGRSCTLAGERLLRRLDHRRGRRAAQGRARLAQW
ncbi:MAG TPA: DUF427 domain-containing protein [Solirubrobacteraceae bacterium]|jgi:uncharacterized protein (DUF427 family)|nr:DUF427 domain-containing protein [Solirubrobacteraceae bacterium]